MVYNFIMRMYRWLITYFFSSNSSSHDDDDNDDVIDQKHDAEYHWQKHSMQTRSPFCTYCLSRRLH